MEETKTKNKTILIVEDEASLQLVVRKKFELSKFEVLSAKSYDEALTILKKEKVDAIWLDHYLLGKEDGLDLVKKIKEEGSPWKSIPIFVISNTASPEKVKTYLHLGVDKYYTKADYKLNQIVSYIKNVLAKE